MDGFPLGLDHEDSADQVANLAHQSHALKITPPKVVMS